MTNRRMTCVSWCCEMLDEWCYVRGRTKADYLKCIRTSMRESSVRKRKGAVFFYIREVAGDSNEVVPWGVCTQNLRSQKTLVCSQESTHVRITPASIICQVLGSRWWHFPPTVQTLLLVTTLFVHVKKKKHICF